MNKRRIVSAPSTRLLLMAAVIGLLFGTGDALAYNVPGSTGLILPSVVRETTLAVIDSSSKAAAQATERLRHQSQPQGAPLAYAPDVRTVDPARFALAYADDPGMPVVEPSRFALGVDIQGHHIEDTGDELPFDYDFLVGSVALSYAVTPDLYVAVTGIVDGGSGDTDFNDGELDHLAVGGSTHLFWYPSQPFRLALSGGYSAVSYDVERSDGAVTGDFDADRIFFDASGSWLGAYGAWRTTATAGLRYVKQWNDSYTESGPGGGSVPDSEISFLRAYSELQVGYNFGAVTPYALGRLGYDLDAEDDAPTAALALLQSDLEEVTSALGGGVSIDSGQARFVLQGTANLTGDEISGYTGSARLGLAF
jgi:hypothetical protein